MARYISTFCRHVPASNRIARLVARSVALVGLAWTAFCAPAAVAQVSEIEKLSRLCKPLWGEMSAECFASLDKLYVGRDVTRNWHSEHHEDPAAGPSGPWTPLPIADRIVWRDVFTDPMALRRRVDEAAARAECRAMEGESRPELRDACAADAFARLSVLYRACGRILYWDGNEYHDGWAFEWEWERRWLHEDVRDSKERARRTATLAESELHFAWRLRKCRTVPAEAVSRVFALWLPPHHATRKNQYVELLQVAARLGSPWANTQAGAVPKDVNATATWDLPLAYIRRAAGAALEHNAPASMYLPFLLAARDYDLHAQPRIDWSELPHQFSEDEIKAATPAAERLLAMGWQPLQEKKSKYPNRPWATAPPVVETRFIARRYDRHGNLRWVYPNGQEHWFAPDGTVEVEHTKKHGEELFVAYHTQTETAGVMVRQWTDEAGIERGTDKDGYEHWIDDDGTERWVDWGGTEWVLLPVGVPLPEDAE